METDRYPNQIMAALHINIPLPDAICASELPIDSSELKLFERLSGINGVVNVSFRNKYQINFEKGKVFDWDYIISDARDIIANHFNHTLQGE